MNIFAGGGFAVMACALADKRMSHTWSSCTRGGPVSRASANEFPNAFPASAEFYRIVDTATRCMESVPEMREHGCTTVTVKL